VSLTLRSPLGSPEIGSSLSLRLYPLDQSRRRKGEEENSVGHEEKAEPVSSNDQPCLLLPLLPLDTLTIVGVQQGRREEQTSDRKFPFY